MSPHDENPDPVLRVLHNMRSSVRVLAAATIALYLILAVALVTGFLLLNERAEENRGLIRQAAEARAENRARYKRSDVLLCQEIEHLKAQNRADALETYRNLGRTLRVLRLERTPEIEDVALENLTNDLRRNEARLGGCGELPSLGAGG